MAAPRDEHDARVSLNSSVAAMGAEIHHKYGPQIGWRELC